MKIKIAFLRPKYDACGYYRTYVPFRGLTEKGHLAYYDLPIKDIHKVDFLYFQRLVFTPGTIKARLNDMRKWKEQGKKIIIDYDDNYFDLEKTNPVYNEYDEGTLDRIKEIIKLADAITTTVKPLAELFSKFHHNVHVLPNFIDVSTLSQRKADSKSLVVGWQGSVTHQEDLKIIRSVINELKSTVSFDFVLSGYRPEGYFKKSTYRKWQDFSPELTHYDLFRDFDIGLCPLQNTPFNICRSDIKFVEYSSLGIPTIASDIVTYNTIRQGETGYLAHNQSDWRKYLIELINDDEKRKKIGKNAKDYVIKERTIQSNIWIWEELLGSL